MKRSAILKTQCVAGRFRWSVVCWVGLLAGLTTAGQTSPILGLPGLPIGFGVIVHGADYESEFGRGGNGGNVNIRLLEKPAFEAKPGLPTLAGNVSFGDGVHEIASLSGTGVVTIRGEDVVILCHGEFSAVKVQRASGTRKPTVTLKIGGPFRLGSIDLKGEDTGQELVDGGNLTMIAGAESGSVSVISAGGGTGGRGGNGGHAGKVNLEWDEARPLAGPIIAAEGGDGGDGRIQRKNSLREGFPGGKGGNGGKVRVVGYTSLSVVGVGGGEGGDGFAEDTEGSPAPPQLGADGQHGGDGGDGGCLEYTSQVAQVYAAGGLGGKGGWGASGFEVFLGPGTAGGKGGNGGNGGKGGAIEPWPGTAQVLASGGQGGDGGDGGAGATQKITETAWEGLAGGTGGHGGNGGHAVLEPGKGGAKGSGAISGFTTGQSPLFETAESGSAGNDGSKQTMAGCACEILAALEPDSSIERIPVNHTEWGQCWKLGRPKNTISLRGGDRLEVHCESDGLLDAPRFRIRWLLKDGTKRTIATCVYCNGRNFLEYHVQCGKVIRVIWTNEEGFRGSGVHSDDDGDRQYDYDEYDYDVKTDSLVMRHCEQPIFQKVRAGLPFCQERSVPNSVRTDDDLYDFRWDWPGQPVSTDDGNCGGNLSPSAASLFGVGILDASVIRMHVNGLAIVVQIPSGTRAWGALQKLAEVVNADGTLRNAGIVAQAVEAGSLEGTAELLLSGVRQQDINVELETEGTGNYGILTGADWPQLAADVTPDGLQVSWRTTARGFKLERGTFVEGRLVWRPVGEPEEHEGLVTRVSMEIEQESGPVFLRTMMPVE